MEKQKAIQTHLSYSPLVKAGSVYNFFLFQTGEYPGSINPKPV